MGEDDCRDRPGEDRLRNAPVGHFYEVMTHGYGAMFDYADRIAPDDRWAFTTRSTPLEYDAAAALAAASRVLRGYNDELADECLKTATRVWDDEHSHAPNIFRSFNTTGGDLQSEVDSLLLAESGQHGIIRLGFKLVRLRPH